MMLTIVQLDIKDSTDLIRRLKLPPNTDDHNLEKEAQNQIIKFLKDDIGEGFEKIGKTGQYLRKLETSSPPRIRYEFDQAKIIFKSEFEFESEFVNEAHKFAVAIHELRAEKNKSFSIDKEWFYYRIAIASGDIYTVLEQNFYRGTPLFRASRLEKKANPGEIFIDEYTRNALSYELQQKYPEDKKVEINQGKDIIISSYFAWCYKPIKCEKKFQNYYTLLANQIDDKIVYYTEEEMQEMVEVVIGIKQLFNESSLINIINQAATETISRQIQHNYTLKARLKSFSKAGKLKVLKAIFNHPLFIIPAEIIEGWLKTE